MASSRSVGVQTLILAGMLVGVVVGGVKQFRVLDCLVGELEKTEKIILNAQRMDGPGLYVSGEEFDGQEIRLWERAVLRAVASEWPELN